MKLILITQLCGIATSYRLTNVDIWSSQRWMQTFWLDICLQSALNLWCDLGKSIRTRTCDISVLYLIEVLIWRGTFCWKLHLNWTSGSKVMSNWRILKTRVKRNLSYFWLYLAISAPDFQLIPVNGNTGLNCKIINKNHFTKQWKSIFWSWMTIQGQP